MKSILPVLFAGLLAFSAVAQEAKTNPAPATTSVTNALAKPVATFPAAAAVISAPFVLTNGVISQPDLSEVTDGGKAVYSFMLTNAGTYLITGMANATDDSSNSFFVNVDTQPDDQMIWDIDVTNGFEERTVNWRGNGDASSGEFVPKRFKLAAGAHQLIVVGREPTQLKSLSIHPTAD